METNEERVLAYKLAKEIDPKDLVEVSGGSLQGTAGPIGTERSLDGNAGILITVCIQLKNIQRPCTKFTNRICNAMFT